MKSLLLFLLSYHFIFTFNSSLGEFIELCKSGTKCFCELTNRFEGFPTTEVDCSFVRDFDFNSKIALPDNVSLLDMSGNNLTEITRIQMFTSNTLKMLFLTKNGIKIISVHALQLPELSDLDLSFNELEMLDPDVFQFLKKLKYLNLASNKFTQFLGGTFKHLNVLEYIVLDDNYLGEYLQTFSLFQENGMELNAGLAVLSLGNIGLKTVPENFLSKAYNLRQFRISRNNITIVPETPYTLEILDLSHTQISEITSEDFSNHPALKELFLNDMIIDEIGDFVFADLKSLEKLELAGNRNLRKFSKLAFGQNLIDDPFHFPLKQISLRGSSLTTLHSDLETPFWRLSKLDLQGNPWLCDCRIIWISKLQLAPEDYDHIRCALPPSLHNSRLFDIDTSKLSCETPWQRYHTFVMVTMILLCILLGCVGAWIVCGMPNYSQRKHLIQSIILPNLPYHKVTVTPNTAMDIQ